MSATSLARFLLQVPELLPVGAWAMKFNPYAALLLTTAVMLITVVLFQTGSSTALLRAGVASVDRNMSGFAARTWTSLERRPIANRFDQPGERPTRVAAIDKQRQEGPTAD